MHISILYISSHGLSDAVKYPLNIAHQTFHLHPSTNQNTECSKSKLWRMPRLDILQHVFGAVLPRPCGTIDSVQKKPRGCY